MKRRKFLKGFAAAVAVVSVAPMAIASEDNSVFDTKRLQDRLDFLRRNPLTEAEALDGYKHNILIADEVGYMAPKDVLDFYNRTRILVWRSHDNSVERLELLRTRTQDIEAYKKALNENTRNGDSCNEVA